MADPTRLDLTGLRCPLPVLRLEAAARRHAAGTILIVEADDPLARVDIPHAMRTKGHSCVEKAETTPELCVFEVTLGGLG